MLLTFTEKNGNFVVINCDTIESIECRTTVLSVSFKSTDGYSSHRNYEITREEREKILNFFQKPLDNT